MEAGRAELEALAQWMAASKLERRLLGKSRRKDASWRRMLRQSWNPHREEFVHRTSECSPTNVLYEGPRPRTNPRGHVNSSEETPTYRNALDRRIAGCRRLSFSRSLLSLPSPGEAASDGSCPAYPAEQRAKVRAAIERERAYVSLPLRSRSGARRYQNLSVEAPVRREAPQRVNFIDDEILSAIAAGGHRARTADHGYGIPSPRHTRPDRPHSNSRARSKPSRPTVPATSAGT